MLTLTKEHVDAITSFLDITEKDLPFIVAQKLKHKENILTSLVGQTIPEHKLDKLSNIIQRHWFKSQISPGECVGVQASLSIGEPLSQSTLNTFHSTGSANSSAVTIKGVPRFNEIISAKLNQKTSVSTFRFKDIDRLSIYEAMCLAKQHIEYCNVKKIVEDIQYFTIDDNTNEKPWLIQSSKLFYNIFDRLFGKKYIHYNYCIRLILSRKDIVLYNITPYQLGQKIQANIPFILPVASNIHERTLDLYFDLNIIPTIEKILSFKKIKGRKASLLDDDYIFIHYVLIEFILDIQLSGIVGITETFIQKDKRVEVNGKNLRALLSHHLIDSSSVTSNDMHEVYSILGTDATCEFLMTEITQTLAFGGANINENHIKLLVQAVMLHKGVITPINVSGISKISNSAIGLMAFERTYKHIIDHALKGTKDYLNDIGSEIIVGRKPGIGTNYFEVRQNLNASQDDFVEY
jgi:DNA-directed RNA polymerase beta' subunit